MFLPDVIDIPDSHSLDTQNGSRTKLLKLNDEYRQY